MSTETPRTKLQTLEKIIQIYKQPDLPDAEESLLTLADLLHLIKEHGMGSANIALNDVQSQILAIFAALRPLIGARIGQLIGSLSRRAEQEIDAEIQAHRDLIHIITENENSPEGPSIAYDELLQKGWKSHLTREEWAGDSFERGLSQQAEKFFIGRLESERNRIQELFQEFVSGEGTL